MRVAGSLCVVVGLALTALLLLLPAQILVLGSSAECGVPIDQAFSHRAGGRLTPGQVETNQCIEQSRHRLLAGGVSGLILVVGGLAMLSTEARRS